MRPIPAGTRKSASRSARAWPAGVNGALDACPAASLWRTM
jgi:hypothetical protein